MLGHARQLKRTCNTCHKHKSHHPVSVAVAVVFAAVEHEVDDVGDFLRYNNWHKCQERILPIALSQLCHEYAAVEAVAMASAPDDVCNVRGMGGGVVDGRQCESNVLDKDNDDVAWAHTMKLINEIQ